MNAAPSRGQQLELARGRARRTPELGREGNRTIRQSGRHYPPSHRPGRAGSAPAIIAPDATLRGPRRSAAGATQGWLGRAARGGGRLARGRASLPDDPALGNATRSFPDSRQRPRQRDVGPRRPGQDSARHYAASFIRELLRSCDQPSGVCCVLTHTCSSDSAPPDVSGGPWRKNEWVQRVGAATGGCASNPVVRSDRDG
jgi:hypothetical protein